MTTRKYGGRVALTCERCGHQFTRPLSRVKDHAFCSRACYFASGIPSANAVKANKTRFPDGGLVLVACAHCHTSFERFKSQAGSKRAFCSAKCMKAFAVSAALPQTVRGGYVRIFIGVGALGASRTGHIPEHRAVMQSIIGRPLTSSENVHHVNGVRSDNRPENLELWSTSQPSGQRVADKLAWAKQFIEQYESLDDSVI